MSLQRVRGLFDCGSDSAGSEPLTCSWLKRASKFFRSSSTEYNARAKRAPDGQHSWADCIFTEYRQQLG